MKKIIVRVQIIDPETEVTGWADMQGFTEADLKLAPAEFAGKHLASGFGVARDYFNKAREAVEAKREAMATFSPIVPFCGNC
jgi:hypothetical protein